MPATLTYPGVYIEEIPSGVRTITGVATSITAFIGYTQRGLDNRATQIFSFADYERAFGELTSRQRAELCRAAIFSQRRREAWVVRVPKHESEASVGYASGWCGCWLRRVVKDHDAQCRHMVR